MERHFTPNVYNQWLKLFRKHWEETHEKERKRKKVGRKIKDIERPVQKELE